MNFAHSFKPRRPASPYDHAFAQRARRCYGRLVSCVIPNLSAKHKDVPNISTGYVFKQVADLLPSLRRVRFKVR